MPTPAIPESRRYLLDQPVLVHVATTGPQGEPQVNPCWFLWKDGLLYLSIGPDGQKARNLQRDPRIALSMVDTGDSLVYLELRGRVTGWQTVDSDDPIVLALVRKYTGQDRYEGEPDSHTVITIEPLHWTTMW